MVNMDTGASNLNATSQSQTDSVRLPNNVFFIIGSFIAVPNICAFVSMWRTTGIPKKIKIPILNLLICDILTGISLLSYLILLNTSPTNKLVCSLQVSWTSFTAFASFACITGVSIDRCVCLYFEHFYMTKVTVGRVTGFQACIWVLAIIFALSVYIDVPSEFPVCLPRFVVGNIGHIFQFVYGVVVRVTSAVAYVLIYLKIRKMRKTDITNGVSYRGIYKTTSKLLTIALTYQVMYFPMFCYNLLAFLVPGNPGILQGVGVIASLCTVLNSLANPFIYAWRFPECRIQLKMMIYFWSQNIIRSENTKRKRILVSFLDANPSNSPVTNT